MLFCSLICTAVLAMPFPAEDWQPGDPFFPAPDQLPDEPTWIPLDELGALTPGLPPTIEVQGVGDEAMDQFRIVLHGFWVEPFHHLEEEAHERFLTFKIPGMTTLSEVGLPALPTTTFTWGLATVTEQLEIGSYEEADVVYFDDARVAPFQGAVMETEQGGEVIPFTIDEQFYMDGPGGSWPQDAGGVRTGPNLNFGGLPLGRAEFAPFRFDPALNRLEVVRRIEGTISRPGGPLLGIELPRSWFGTARSLLANLDWLVWEEIVQRQPAYWSGRYLIVHPDGWLDELQPLITLKQERGYRVDRITVESIDSSDPDDFHAAIEAWYLAAGNHRQVCAPGW